MRSQRRARVRRAGRARGTRGSPPAARPRRAAPRGSAAAVPPGAAPPPMRQRPLAASGARTRRRSRAPARGTRTTCRRSGAPRWRSARRPRSAVAGRSARARRDPARRQANLLRMLEGKRIFITGGAGFIGTTLARELVDRNTVVAYDNLHRDVLSGTGIGDHPNFSFVQGDILDQDAMRVAAAGATHFVHCAAIAGVDTVLQSPVRVVRVNVIGTYNALEAAIATLPTLERFVDFSTSEVFGTHAANVTEGQVSTIGSVGEARWTYAVSKLAGEHMAHRSEEHTSELQSPVHLVCRLLLEKKKKKKNSYTYIQC